MGHLVPSDERDERRRRFRGERRPASTCMLRLAVQQLRPAFPCCCLTVDRSSRLPLSVVAMSPAFATNESLWPIDGTPAAQQQARPVAGGQDTAPSTTSPSKSKPRHRVRRKPEGSTEAAATTPPPVPSVTGAASAGQASASKVTAEAKPRNGHSNRGGRGRGGRGGSSSSDSRSGGPPGTRAFATAGRGAFNGGWGGNSSADDVGVRLARVPFSRESGGGPTRGGLGAQSADWRRGVHTYAATASEDSAAAEVGHGRQGKAKAKKTSDSDKGTALLEHVASTRDNLEEQILQLYEVSAHGSRPMPFAPILTGPTRRSNDLPRPPWPRGSTSSTS